MNTVPTPLFDTQVAALVCGHGEAASYESLATKLAKAQIEQVEPVHRLESPPPQRAADHLCAVRCHASARGLREAPAPAREERPPALDHRGNGRIERSSYLSRRSGTRLAPPEAARRFAPSAWRAQGSRRLARAYGAAHRHSAPAPAARRTASRNRQPRAKTADDSPRRAASAAALPKAGRAARSWRRSRRRARCRTPSCRRVTGRPSRYRAPGAVVDLLRTLLRLKAEQAGVAARLVANADELDRLAAGKRGRPCAERLAQRGLRS